MGLGKQGIDTLVWRSHVAALGLTVELLVASRPTCAGIAGCALDFIAPLGFCLLLIAALICVAAVPAAWIWNGRRLWQAQLPWHQLARPRAPGDLFLAATLAAIALWYAASFLVMVFLMPKY